MARRPALKEVFYRLFFGGPFEWERVEVSPAATSGSFHLTPQASEALTISDGATCALFGHESLTTIPGTRTRVCLRCGVDPWA